MCDYSLEAYHSRPARAGESVTTHRFPSGSLGFVNAENTGVAICMACDTKLELENLPANIQSTCGVKDTEAVTFVQLDTSPYRDGVRFDNGKSVTLQQLGAGVVANVLDILTTPTELANAPVREDATARPAPVRRRRRILEPAE